MKKYILFVAFITSYSLLHGQTSGNDIRLNLQINSQGRTDLYLIHHSVNTKIAEYPSHGVLMDYIANSSDSVSIIIKYDVTEFLYQKLVLLDDSWTVVNGKSWVYGDWLKYTDPEKLKSIQFKLKDDNTIVQIENGTESIFHFHEPRKN